MTHEIESSHEMRSAAGNAAGAESTPNRPTRQDQVSLGQRPLRSQAPRPLSRRERF